jgi:hypothetical protein
MTGLYHNNYNQLSSVLIRLKLTMPTLTGTKTIFKPICFFFTHVVNFYSVGERQSPTKTTDNDADQTTMDTSNNDEDRSTTGTTNNEERIKMGKSKILEELSMLKIIVEAQNSKIKDLENRLQLLQEPCNDM